MAAGSARKVETFMPLIYNSNVVILNSPSSNVRINQFQTLIDTILERSVDLAPLSQNNHRGKMLYDNALQNTKRNVSFV
jgi:hypothetical protein